MGGNDKKKMKLSELEDVKPPPEPIVEPKKPVKDRPKTVKTFHTKFRSTGNISQDLILVSGNSVTVV